MSPQKRKTSAVPVFRPNARWRARALVAALSLGVAHAATALDLTEAFRLAEQNDPNFAANQKRAEQDVAGVDVARSRLLPSVTFSASAGRSQTDTEYLSGLAKGRTVNNDYQSRNWNLTARQPLYRASDWAGWKRAEAQAEASQISVEAARVRLLRQVAQAYAQALSARAQRAVAQQDVARYELVLKQAERAYALGSATRTDVEDAKARLDIAQAAVLKQEGALQQALAALAALIGRAVTAEELDAMQAVPPLAEQTLAKPLTAWIDAAHTNHPEVRALVAQEAAVQQQVEQQRGQHKPTVDLVVSRRMSRSDSETTIGQQYDTTSAAVQLQIPLYAGGGIDASVRAALAALEEAQLRTEAKRRELTQAVTQAYTALRFGYAQWQALEQAERSAQQAVIGTEKGIQAGTRNAVDLLNAQQELAKVRANRIDAAYQVLVAAIDLWSAAQGGVDAVLGQLAEAVAPNRALQHTAAASAPIPAPTPNASGRAPN
ncbi:TolC family outer membrane protein [Hydrogenophilus thiooxidans]|uniref:TolC family outer membrane protein n=1 Tax=Hydrogenophilus thiooxidans TaxID=2820326 RepID=UPI001C21B4B4|nr:TolC family outer membrane protein [Hydrogenophilus thiooxidans]